MGKILRSKPIERVCKDQVFTKMTTTDLDIDTLANKGKIIIYLHIMARILQIFKKVHRFVLMKKILMFLKYVEFRIFFLSKETRVIRIFNLENGTRYFFP